MLSSVTLPQWRAPTRRGYAEASRTRTTEGGAEGLGPIQTALFSSLWSIGIAQQYQLFNWIDERNYSVRYKIIEYEGGTPGREIEPGSTSRTGVPPSYSMIRYLTEKFRSSIQLKS